MCYNNIPVGDYMTKQEYIKKFNLIATKSIKDLNTLYSFDFNLSDHEINYDKSFNIYEILKDFTVLRQAIKYKYWFLKDNNIANDMDVFSYIKEEDYELLQFLLRYPNPQIYNKGVIAYLNLYCKNDTYYAEVTNCFKPDDVHFDSKQVDINPILIKDYMTLGRKYTKLISSYRELKKYFGKSYYEGELNFGLMLDGDLLSDINYYKLSFGLTKVDFEVIFDKDLNVIAIERINTKLDFKDEDIIDIAKSIYMHKKIIKNIIPSKTKDRQKIK